MKNLVYISAIILFSSCMSGTPLLKMESDNNKTYKIDYLFEQDGNKMYRFYDNGNYVYFTTSSNTDSSLVTSITNDSIAKQTITIVNKK